MWHTLGDVDQFFLGLLEADRQFAEQLRQQGCPCGGRLHRADYPRKPRGVPESWETAFSRRFSFCCAKLECRRRATPPSVRFAGRRVYIAALVLLCCARRVSPEEAGCSPRTARRWMTFFRETMVQTPIWRRLCARLMPPLAADGLPATLLERFLGDEATRVRQCLEFLAPFSTRRAGDSMDA